MPAKPPAKRKRNGRAFTAAESHQIQSLIQAGTSASAIAKAVGCSRTTLRKYFGDALTKRGRGGPNGVRVWTLEERELVSFTSALGIEPADIAAVIGLSTGALQAAFPEELALSKAKLDMAVIGTLVGAALNGSERLLIHYARARVPGWNDRAKAEEAVDPLTGQAELIRSTIEHLDATGRDALRVVLAQLGAASPITDARKTEERLH